MSRSSIPPTDPEPDALNKTLVAARIRRLLPALESDELRKLVAYAIMGAGMINVHRLLDDLPKEGFDRIRRHFRTWLDGRDVNEFYSELFEANGYKCREVKWLERSSRRTSV